MSHALRIAIPVIAVAAAISACSKGNPRKVELPDSVAAAFNTRFPGAAIRATELETEDGVAVYDVEFMDAGTERECDIASDGTILNAEAGVEAGAVPEAAMQALLQASTGCTIKHIGKSEIFAEPKTGGIVKLDAPRIEYEAEVEKDGRRGEVTVGADGAIVEPLKWDVDGKES